MHRLHSVGGGSLVNLVSGGDAPPVQKICGGVVVGAVL